MKYLRLLLRGIDVGGKNKVSTAELKSILKMRVLRAYRVILTAAERPKDKESYV